LLKSKRKELHRLVARTITDKFPAVAEAQPEILARHWSDAGEADLAVAAWTKAARAARARHAFKEAEEGYRQSLAMLGTLPQSPARDARELELVSALGLVLWATKGPSASETVDIFARSRAMAEKSGNLSQLALEVAVNGLAVYAAGDYAGAASLADQAFDLARREGSDTCLRLAHEAQFLVRYSRGDLVGAEKHFTSWRGICEVSGFGPLPNLTTLWLAYGGYCAWALGLTEKAGERMAEAIAFARDSKSPFEIAQASLGRVRCTRHSENPSGPKLRPPRL
jgi:tetratricopeptide (TPR) repeat protein